MEAVNVMLFLKAALRVIPTFLLFRFVFEVGVLLRLFFALPLTLILSQRLAQNYLNVESAQLEFGDLLMGLSVGVFVSLLFTAISKASVFFSPSDEDEGEETNIWRQVINSFLFVFTLILFMALGIEKSLLEFLASESISLEKLKDLSVLSSLLTDLSWLALKVSSFGLLFSLMKNLFEEVYRRLGGESFRLIFSTCAWIVLLLLSPILVPSFGEFVSHEMSKVWTEWIGGVR